MGNDQQTDTPQRVSEERLTELISWYDGEVRRMRDYALSSYPGAEDTASCLHELLAARPALEALRKQVAALSRIDEQGMGHDDAMSRIAHHVHEIQVLCDAFGYDPSEWLQDEVANECELIPPPKEPRE